MARRRKTPLEGTKSPRSPCSSSSSSATIMFSYSHREATLLPSDKNTASTTMGRDSSLESEEKKIPDDEPIQRAVSDLSPKEQLEILPLETVDIESIRNRWGLLTDSAIFHIMFSTMDDELRTSPFQLVEPTWLAQWALLGMNLPDKTPYFFKSNPECNVVIGLIIPFNIGSNHWTCIFVNLENNYAVLYDSNLSSVNTALAHRVMLVFYDTFKDQFRGNHDVPFRFKAATDCEQQQDGSSCGVFTCRYMMDLLQGQDPNNPRRRYREDQWSWRRQICKQLNIPFTSCHQERTK